MLLKDLITIAIALFIIRYPVLDSDDMIFRIPLIFDTLFVPIIKKSSKLCSQTFYTISCTISKRINNKASGEKNIENKYQLNKIISKIKPNENNECEIYLSIQIEGRKAYGDWELAEVLQQFLKHQGSFLADIGQFNIIELPDQDPSIESDALQMFIKDLKQKRNNFHIINANEIICREFIFLFINSAVTHVRSKKSKLQLKTEEWINESCEYKPIVYSVNL
ncbi:1781_t:CDS:2, partial [Funneliformis caledonium]